MKSKGNPYSTGISLNSPYTFVTLPEPVTNPSKLPVIFPFALVLMLTVPDVAIKWGFAIIKTN